MAQNLPLTDLEKKAWSFAEEKHKGQVRAFSKKPYFDAHVKGVNDLVKKYINDEYILCVAILHDVIEDCYNGNLWEGYAEIKEIFGKKIAEGVWMLTSNKDEIKYRYDGSKTNYLIDKMIKMYEVDVKILITKLCDRAKNIDDIFSASANFRFKYYFETLSILNTLYNKLKNRPHKLNQVLNMVQGKMDNVAKMFSQELSQELY